MLRLSSAAAMAVMACGTTISSFPMMFLSRALISAVKLRRLPPCSLRSNFCVFAAPVVAEADAGVNLHRHSVLLERLRERHLKDSTSKPQLPRARQNSEKKGKEEETKKKKSYSSPSSFEELGLNEEVMASVREMGISSPTEIQCLGISALLGGKSVVLGSHTGSGKTLAYMLPLVQLLRRDEELSGMPMKPGRPRCVVFCPTRELCEQVFRVAKSISHHARFRSIMISGGCRLRPQEDSLNLPIDMVVGTPGRFLQHIEDGNLAYGDIKYLVLDEADTMFDRGFGPDIRKFLAPLKHRAGKPGDHGFQTVMVTATMTKAVQKLIDEEFEGLFHLRTNSFHKKIASARHDFIKISGSENKLESLMQILEPSLAKGNRVMVFCNTLNSSRAVDHFLRENQFFTVNYHGEVPAEERVENLKKFKSEEGDCPTLVCTDLAARGLDLDVDHVIMFDFPLNSIDYLHRTGRTARMGAKGLVTSLVAKKDFLLASRIEEAIKKNESLEALNSNNVRVEAKTQTSYPKMINSKTTKAANSKVDKATVNLKSPPFKDSKRSTTGVVPAKSASRRSLPRVKITKKVVTPNPAKSKAKASSPLWNKKKPPRIRKQTQSVKSNSSRPEVRKISVVGFRGRSSSMRRESPRTG